jgi:hypothetical protein
MKCPKCGYNSFDHNDVCPKCNRDVTGERERLRNPSYRPEPPFLLNALTGHADKSIPKVENARLERELEEEPGLEAEDSQALEAMEIAFNEGQGLEFSLEPMDVDESLELLETDLEEPITPALEEGLGPEEEAETVSLDFGELSIEELASVSSVWEQAEGDSKTPLDKEISSGSVQEQSSALDVEDAIAFDDFSIDELGLTLEEGTFSEREDEVTVDLEDLASVVREINEEREEPAHPEKGSGEETFFRLEDLKDDVIGHATVYVDVSLDDAPKRASSSPEVHEDKEEARS